MATSPISLRIRADEVYGKARRILAEAEEAALLRRRTQLAAFKALHQIRKAFELEEQLLGPYLSEPAKARWRTRQKVVEAEMRRITQLKLPR